MANQQMVQSGLPDSGISVGWSAKSSVPSSGLLEIPKPSVNLDLAPTIYPGMAVKPLKFPLDPGDSLNFRSESYHTPTFGGYSGSSPICTPSRAGFLTGGSSGAVGEECEERNPADVLVAVVIALLMLGAMASRIL